MDQSSKKKIKKMLELPDHEFAEKLFGKKAMREIDKLVESRSEDAETKSVNDSIKES